MTLNVGDRVRTTKVITDIQYQPSNVVIVPEGITGTVTAVYYSGGYTADGLAVTYPYDVQFRGQQFGPIPVMRDEVKLIRPYTQSEEKMESLKFKVGDRVQITESWWDTTADLEIGDAGTIVDVQLNFDYSLFPYDVLFDKHADEDPDYVWPMSEKELIAEVKKVPWYSRLWNRVKTATEPRDAERHFGTEETVKAFENTRDGIPVSIEGE